MSTVWKALLGLAIVVPLGAYVAGSLAASASDDEPAPRDTIVIERSTSPTQAPTQAPAPSRSPSGSADPDDVETILPEYDDYDDDDDHGDDDGDDRADRREDRREDRQDRREDRREDREDRREDRDDHSGPGGGED